MAPRPIIRTEVREVKDAESTSRFSIKPLVCDARTKNMHNLATKQIFQEKLRKIDPNMGLSQMANKQTDEVSAKLMR